MGLTLSGACTQVLTGSNTYSGSTTIAGGTLQIGSGGATGSIGGTVAVADSGLLAFDRSSGTTSFAAAISGAGGLTQMGPNLLILTGSNTYSGSTTIAGGGTLQIGSGAAAGSINNTGQVTDNGLLAFNLSSGTTTLAGNISGSGGLAQMGGNLLSLTGSNNYAGPTTISAGTLAMGGSNALLGATRMSISSGAVLDLGRYSPTIGSLTGSGTVTNSVGGSTSTLTLAPVTGTTTFSGVIQNGNGQTALSLNGPGTEVLTGSNTYSGSTTIATGGILQIGSGGATGSINSTGGVTDNGTLAFDLSGPATFSKAVTGSGSLVQMGPGVLTLATSNSYTGGTSVSKGTLDIASAAALPTIGIVNVGRPGTVDLTSLLAVYLPSIADISTDADTSAGSNPAGRLVRRCARSPGDRGPGARQGPRWGGAPQRGFRARRRHASQRARAFHAGLAGRRHRGPARLCFAPRKRAR